MPRTPKRAAPKAATPEIAIPADAPAADEVEETEAEPEVTIDDVVAAVAAVDDDDDEDDDVDDVVVVADDDDVEVLVEKPVVAARPAGRPSPGRPPGAKEEPDPPFYIGERVRLVTNVRPRTGVAIGAYPVGAEARVETVLSLTCILRFQQASDTKEVVAFTCLESIDPECIVRREERDSAKAAAEKAAAKAAEKA